MMSSVAIGGKFPNCCLAPTGYITKKTQHKTVCLCCMYNCKHKQNAKEHDLSTGSAILTLEGIAKKLQ